MTDLLKIAENLAAAGLDHPAVDDAVIKLTNMAAHPSRGVVDDAMVTRYLDAVHEYLGGLTKKQWQAERQDNAAALRRAARIGLTAALEGQVAALPAVPEGMVLVPREPTEAMLTAARDWSHRKYGKPIGSDDARGCYAAMLAATPAHDQPEGEG